MKIEAIATAVLVVCLAVLFYIWKDWPNESLHIVFCDVGQGDAILIQHGFMQALVDAGANRESVMTCLSDRLPFWDRKIEWMIPSHYDSDHIAAAVAILQQYRVESILLPLGSKNTAEFEAFKAAVLEEVRSGAVITYARSGQVLQFAEQGQIQVLLGAERSNSETQLWDASQFAADPHDEMTVSTNDLSTVLLLTFKEKRFLFTGDLEAAGEEALITSNLVPPVDVLKAGHHGSKSSTTMEFLQAIQPETVVISAGKNNSYGHPSPETLARLKASGIERVLRTDQLGTIIIESDGIILNMRTSSHR